MTELFVSAIGLIPMHELIDKAIQLCCDYFGYGYIFPSLTK